MKKHLKKLSIFMFIFSPIILSACTSANNTLSNGNEWSLPSKKLGMQESTPTKIETWSKSGYNLKQMFNLSLKNSNVDKQKIVDDLNKLLNNKGDEIFNNQNPIVNNFSTYKKMVLLDKYFNNTNKSFPYWLAYDVRLKYLNNHIEMKITVIDSTKEVNDSLYKLQENLTF